MDSFSSNRLLSFPRRLAARADVGGPHVFALAFSFNLRSIHLAPFRYAQGPGLGFGSGKLSAAEELRFRRFLSYLWGFDEDVERRRVVAIGSLGLGLRSVFNLRSRPELSIRQEEGRLFSFWSSTSLRVPVDLVTTVASRELEYAGGWCSSSVHLAMVLSVVKRAVVYAASVSVCNTSSHQISSWRFLAASVSVRRFSRSTSEAAVLMSLTTVFRSLVFAHIPASMGSLELLVVMCVTIVCRFGVHIREYGSCDPFYSV
ncbi:hypothetical protein Bca101_038733 [Brassica carinata]